MTKNNDNICNHNTCRPTSCRPSHAPMHGHKHGFHHAPNRSNQAPAFGFAGRPMNCHAHGPMNGFHRGPASGFNRAPAYGFAGKPINCHAHGPMNGFHRGPANGFKHAPAYGFAGRPMNGFHRGPANGCGNGRPFSKGFPAPEFPFCGTDIRRTETGYRLENKLPGFKKDEITVELEGRNLKITAKKAEPAETKEGENACPEKAKRSGIYCRTFRLKGIRTEDITAAFEDGILRVDLPEKERPAPEKKSIAVN